MQTSYLIPKEERLTLDYVTAYVGVRKMKNKPRYKIEQFDEESGWIHFTWRKNDTCLVMAEQRAKSGHRMRVVHQGSVIAEYPAGKKKSEVEKFLSEHNERNRFI
jgi:F0F1-type ATP synthase beta subunit